MSSKALFYVISALLLSLFFITVFASSPSSLFSENSPSFFLNNNNGARNPSNVGVENSFAPTQVVIAPRTRFLYNMRTFNQDGNQFDAVVGPTNVNYHKSPRIEILPHATSPYGTCKIEFLPLSIDPTSNISPAPIWMRRIQFGAPEQVTPTLVTVGLPFATVPFPVPFSVHRTYGFRVTYDDVEGLPVDYVVASAEISIYEPCEGPDPAIQNPLPNSPWINLCIHGTCSIPPPSSRSRCDCHPNYGGAHCDYLITPPVTEFSYNTKGFGEDGNNFESFSSPVSQNVQKPLKITFTPQATGLVGSLRVSLVPSSVEDGENVSLDPVWTNTFTFDATAQSPVAPIDVLIPLSEAVFTTPIATHRKYSVKVTYIIGTLVDGNTFTSNEISLYDHCDGPDATDSSLPWSNLCFNGECSLLPSTTQSQCTCDTNWYGDSCNIVANEPVLSFDVVNNDDIQGSPIDPSTALFTPLPSPNGLSLGKNSLVRITIAPAATYPAEGSALISLVKIGEYNGDLFDGQIPSPPQSQIVSPSPHSVLVSSTTPSTHIITLSEAGIYKVVVEYDIETGESNHESNDQVDPSSPPLFIYPLCIDFDSALDSWYDACGSHGHCLINDQCQCVGNWVGTHCNDEVFFSTAVSSSYNQVSFPILQSTSPLEPPSTSDNQVIMHIGDVIDVDLVAGVDTNVLIEVIHYAYVNNDVQSTPTTLFTNPLVTLTANTPKHVSIIAPVTITMTAIVKVTYTPINTSYTGAIYKTTTFTIIPTCYIRPTAPDQQSSRTAWQASCGQNGTCVVDGTCSCAAGYSGNNCEIKDPTHNGSAAVGASAGLVMFLIAVVINNLM